ncbi:MAG: aromatic ring-hydroxylating dioxygenase subunit alpha [Piscinibacter sp.]|uniref:aromatic ring-hydroxylating oxygenase subunit alpha n=1 Tax=Piscinibacter sp. TaxID=1903157 RepID=UPI00258ACF1D|nr:aromatic ring-hydroxylating dioxygenase subunit alpha [Piscinibacter sp.]MCW5663862.1 aromatic ring-hydroxylating dioxygenase subunit alpha [Piscinibacter sp.]
MQTNPLIKDNSYLRHFWHPVCSMKELEMSSPSGLGPLAVKLLNEHLVVAKLGGKIVAMRDRCPHRSAKLSAGKVVGDDLQCPYHGWQYRADGACSHIPALPEGPIPSKARVERFDCEERYGLIWVRLDSSYDCTEIPHFSAANDPKFKIIIQEPYYWKSSAERRWENFTDFSHFAFVHPKTLFDPNAAQPPLVPMDRVNGQFHFVYDTPKGMDVNKLAIIGKFSYICSMPFAINLSSLKYSDNTTSVLFNVACPVSDTEAKNYFIFAREKHDDSDWPHIAFNDLVFAEDKPIIESESPQYIPDDEVSVVTDKVSTQYRKWLRELEAAAKQGKEAFNKALNGRVLESDRVYPE